MSELDKQMILDRIIKLLREKKRTQSGLADYLEISKNIISQWKKGTCDSYMRHLVNIAAFFDVPIDFLVYGKTSEFTETEMKMISLFRQLTEEEQTGLTRITEGMIESKKTAENRIKEDKIAARKIARRTDGEAVRKDITKEELAAMEQLPEETDF